MAKKINVKYLMVDYKAVAKAINLIHGTKYTNRHIKYIHAAKQKYCNNTIKIEIDAMVGPYVDWQKEDVVNDG